QQPRARHHRAADGEHLLLAAAAPSRWLATALAQHGKEREDSLQLSGRVRAVSPREPADPEILEHGHARQHPAPFGHVDHTPPDDLVHGQPDENPPPKSPPAPPPPH